MVNEYLPDLVVSVYAQEDSNPWDIAETLIDPAAYALGNDSFKALSGGGASLNTGNENSRSALDTNDHFKEADVIGNPILPLFSGKFFIPSLAIAYNPYFASPADSIQWRNPLYEAISHPQALVPFYDAIGSFTTGNWGTLYPRVGFLNQPVDAKAAAVIAQRAVDIVTDDGGMHVHQGLRAGDGACGDHCDVAETKVNDDETQWQMIYPSVDEQCSVFGTQTGVPGSAWDNEETQQGQGNYVWVFWRHYEGCIQAGGSWHLVRTTSF